ncbi:MAG: thiol peroxidase [Salinivirgaceae bacterium]|nr:thiol peroxidase [Salinivirgaceae bacterium]MDD4745669.1 thiol peroxidase [Salinivirgaceae bacterium]MDY0280930.1 thiol peroxidase [Salinivirgaceae bacterium]
MSNSKSILFGGNALKLAGNEIKIGDKAPEFTVVGNDLKPVTLSQFKGKNKIISVFPSIDTPVCAVQNRVFNKRIAELENTVVLSISVDLPFAQSRFCGAEGIDKVITLSDHKELDFGKKYGFLINEVRLLARGIVVVGKNDNVVYIEYVPNVGEEPNYEKAINAVKSL